MRKNMTGISRVILKEMKMNDFISDVIKYPNSFSITIKGVASKSGYGVVQESEVSVKELVDIFNAIDKKEEDRHE